MSLLLDALKRAEQEKLSRQGEASNDAPAGAIPLKPAPALELQPVGSASSPSHARTDEPAHAAQLLFDAKAPVGADAKRGRGMLWATLGAIAILVASAGAYVWYQLRVLSPNPAPIVARRAPPPLPQPSIGAPPLAATEVTPAAPTPSTVTLADPAPAAILPPVSSIAPPSGAAAQADDPVTRLLREAPTVQPPAPLKFERAVDRPAIAPDVALGYAALRDGNLAEARRRYETALSADGASVDAQLGLATVEARAGNRSVASVHYRRVLEMDPHNATALAGLAALADGQAPEAVERQLREDVARFPDNAALRFALGTHYAGQHRWGEAQAAFFEAHRIDPTGADILYNLAVSLDHMSQPRLAADFYRRAVEAAQSQPTQFDTAPVQRRLAELAR